MPPPRPFWKGYLKLSLVSCPVALYPATSSAERVAFRQINIRTGHRLRQQLVDDETGDVVDPEDKGRGYEIRRGDYLVIDDDELAAIALPSSQTVEIDSFVPGADIDARFREAAYYLIPEGKVAQDAFAVIRDAMRGTDRVALGRVVLARRERVVALEPWDKGILLTSLRYAAEVRDPAAYFDGIADVAVPADMRALAEHILASKAARFAPDTFRDRYEEAVVALLKAKETGRPAPAAAAGPAGANVGNLMELLRRSLAGQPTESPKPAKLLHDAAALKPKRKPKAGGSAQRELLLPIAGSKDAPAATVGVRTKAKPAPASIKQAKPATRPRRSG